MPQHTAHRPTASTARPFSGSYRPDDVCFLLTPIRTETVGIDEKERLIQSGRRHYSQMLSRESLPSDRYLEIFDRAFATTRTRMARSLLDLAAILCAQRSGEITLVSLVRAGTPVGVALRHILERWFGRQTAHYAVSIIRDRGIDQNALRFLLESAGRDPAGIRFIDGWTGKGVIARELAGSIADFNRRHRVGLDARLFALTDLAGVGVAPSDEDYLIPSSILNATVSGLISRSVLNDGMDTTDFHGCLFYEEFAPHDRSVWFVDELLAEAGVQLDQGYRPCPTPVDPTTGRERAGRLLALVKGRYHIADERLIKPGIGEATRVLLRRVPERVILRDPHAPAVEHLLQLALERQVPWDLEPSLPYQATSLIKGFSDV